MQDRFVGDVGDFGKLLLLRSLTSTTNLRLSVLWYRTPDETHDNAGKHTNLKKLEHLDPPLAQALYAVTASGSRTIERLESLGLLPQETRFHRENLHFPKSMPFFQRRQLRDAWLKNAISSADDCDLVFFDPDNGLRMSSEKCLHAKGWQYVYCEDLKSLWADGKSLLIYHHLNRSCSAEQQIKNETDELQQAFPDAGIEPFHFRRGTGRVYLLLVQNRHRSKIVHWISDFRASPAHDELHRKS